jgi:hypothetical protein
MITMPRKVAEGGTVGTTKNPDTIEIRPISGGSRVSNTGMALVVAGALLAVVALRLGLPRPYGWGLGWWALVVIALLVALLAAPGWLRRRRQALIAGPGYLIQVDWLGRRRTYHQQQIAAVLKESVVYGRGRPMPQIFVIGPGNRRLMLLLPWMWDERDLDALWRRAGIETLGSFDSVETAAQLAARLPGLIPAWRASPTFVPVVATIVVIALALVLFRGAPGYGGP